MKRGISNTSVTEREGVRIPQESCSNDGSGVGSCAAVDISQGSRVFLPLCFHSRHIPFQQVSMDYLECI